ncbi:hypothetical protein AFL01nite_08150 [Aeromicrobium flavum]|uniref:O-antigen ligase-related domain-containing protein n=1 Tax=Aeromicrobium flavum TaxID=416568 RepID=A0A512HSQ2_9ACTN|nr:O-antigen ligase family protein [Aeromicrobium flavum]GEO88488.1 hypothetical protein AFL01nite_08150 [Aeromicrobium flavum]
MQIALILTGVVLVGWFIVQRSVLLVPAVVVLAFLAVPASLPSAVTLGPFSAQLHEPVLAVAVVWAVATHRGSSYAGIRIGALLVLLLLGAISGVLHGNGLVPLIGDLRPLMYLIGAMVVASRLVGTPVWPTVLRTVVLVLWVSATVTAAGSVAGLTVAGQIESASLSDPLAAAGATRLVTSATYLAVAALCGVIAEAVAGLHPLLSRWYVVVPASAIMVLSFSRNNLLALLAAVVVAILWARSARALVYTCGAAILVATIAVTLHVGSPVIGEVPGGAYVNRQVDGYVGRVIEGLGEKSFSSDPSVLYRTDIENPHLMRAFGDSPIAGHGFGHAYKAPMSSQNVFFQDAARYYAHNYYLWLAVKTGIVGLLLFIFALVAPIAAAIQTSNRDALGPAAALAGLLAISVVGPMPNNIPTSTLVGLVAGALVGILGMVQSRRPASTNTILPAQSKKEPVPC